MTDGSARMGASEAELFEQATRVTRLYAEACLSGDEATAAHLRADMHDLIDASLDRTLDIAKRIRAVNPDGPATAG